MSQRDGFAGPRRPAAAGPLHRRRGGAAGLRRPGRAQGPGPQPFQGPATGAAGARDAFGAALKIFSDFGHEVLEQFSDGDYVITRVRGHGRHTGELLGIPATNKDVTMEGIAIHRVTDGRIVEHWSQIDALGLLGQMGALPPTGA